MAELKSSFDIKGIHIRNRFVFPPVVCFGYAADDGIVTEKNIRHYIERSENGAGIIITEATCIRKEGRAASSQLGIWSDNHIAGLSRISSVVKENGALSLIQLHHAGMVAPESVTPIAAGPSADEKNPRTRTLELVEIRSIRDAFILAAVRAKEAGFQGIELHGAHGYLLNQFASSFFNKRQDEYGGDFTGRMKLATEVITGIRRACDDDFLISYRLGANSPLLEDGIMIAKYLEGLGIDILHVSHGGSLLTLPRVPKEIDFNWIVYSGMMIRKEVKLPVILVNEIKTPERAAFLIENGHADFVSVGRPQLADPHWVNRVLHNQPVNECLSCKPKCKWYVDSTLCPARIILERKEGKE